MIKIREIVQTCRACPSQWEAMTEGGEFLYFRYRWGCLRIEKAPAPDRMWDDTGVTEDVFFHDFDDPYHGEMTYKRLREVTADILEMPSECRHRGRAWL